jgi:multidrug efflux pump subunit AcrA (membrane-fusion protein)
MSSCPRHLQRPGAGRQILAIVVLIILAGAVGVGFWQHHSLHAEVMATAQARRDLVPSVRTVVIRASDGFRSAAWPGTTEAFEQANLCAQASGNISKRTVDIGSRVKSGDLLVVIEHHGSQLSGLRASAASCRPID